MTQEMYDLQKEFSDEADFRLLTLSIDPARDTVDVLKKFAKAYYAKPGTWYFARHPERSVLREFVVEGLKIPWDEAEPLNHSYRLVLIDRKGNVRYLHHGYKPGYENDYIDQVRELSRERG